MLFQRSLGRSPRNRSDFEHFMPKFTFALICHWMSIVFLLTADGSPPIRPPIWLTFWVSFQAWDWLRCPMLWSQCAWNRKLMGHWTPTGIEPKYYDDAKIGSILRSCKSQIFLLIK